MVIMKTLISQSIDQTYAIGRLLGDILQEPVFIAIDGDLGSGKTHFVQGLALGLGVSVVPRSPTFAIMEEYEGRLPLLHVDFYRLEEEELEPLGLEEQLELWPGVVAVEWASRFPFLYPSSPIQVHIRIIEDDIRSFQIRGEGHEKLLKTLEEKCDFLQ